jgi:hypothetical protein
VQHRRLAHLRLTIGERVGVRVVPDLMERAHRNAPVRHGAVGIVRGDSPELALRLVVPEIVQESDAAIEGRAHRGGAGHGKAHRSELLLGIDRQARIGRRANR